jgi:hypothetical protein
MSEQPSIAAMQLAQELTERNITQVAQRLDSWMLEFVKRGQAAQVAADHIMLMERIRSCLKRWAARYAETEQAKAHVKETTLLVEEIGEWILKH